MVPRMPEDPKTCIAEEWSLTLLGPASLTPAELVRLRLLVLSHLSTCAAAVARDGSCRLVISPSEASGP